MSVQFDEPAQTFSTHPKKRQTSSFSSIVIKTGLVKTETGAQIVLLIIAAALLAASFTLFIRANQEPPAPTPAQVVL